MPSNYPNITFDSDGVCNHCLSYQEPQLLGKELLLQKIRSRSGERYDCVLGISGGKDSSYVAYLASRELGLRVLAVSYEFPFMVELARENVKAVCEHLGIELLVVKSRNNLEYNLMRNHLMSLAATGTTWGQCMFCHYGIEAILYEMARSRGIPFILSGVTQNETWWDPGSRFGYLARRLKDLPFSEKANFALYQGKAYLGLVDQRRQFPLPGNGPLNAYAREQAPAQGPETIHVFEYMKWDQGVIERILQEETGWQRPPRSLTWRYDCMLEPLLDFTYTREFGISSTGLYLCGLIRSGRMSRHEAMRLLQESEEQAYLDASLRRVMDYLSIPPRTQAKFFDASRG